MMGGSGSRRRGFGASLLFVAPVLLGVPLFTIWMHYALPEPTRDLFHPETGAVQLSEHAILEHARVLSEDIGYRTVGTREHALGDQWMYNKALELQKMCKDAVRRELGRRLQCEVWRQVGSGSHRFDILQTRLYKTYVNLTNIVMRISDGTELGKEHAVLVNAHLDSTLPSPGAGDDALSVGVMIETARYLIHTPGWEPTYAIVLLFNNAEESLQDGSHLFSTQHPIRNTIRAAINLEAAGTEGPELLFQATSEQMIDAYSHVPRPHGTIVANDIFSSGIIMSDTDFRQFELYLNITGLDMAIVGHSYFYHTRKDVVENIEPGAAQHMADNTLALLQYLSSPKSPLPTLTTGYTRPTTVFFSLLKATYFQYSFKTANAMHLILFVSVVLFVQTTTVTLESTATAKGNGSNEGSADTARGGLGMWREQLRGILSVIVSFIGALVGVNTVAFVMSKVLDKSMSWYKVEFSCLLLYGPAALTGGLAFHLVLNGHTRERTLLNAILLTYSALAVLIQLAGIGSAVLFFISAFPLFAVVLLERLVVGGDDVWIGTYVLGQIMPATLATEVFIATSDIFVPLTGRMGPHAPAEFIIATLVALSMSFFLPLVLPFLHHFGRRFLTQALVVSVAFSGLMILVFSTRTPYDPLHPRRVFVLHSENITSNEVHLHIAGSDSSPGFENLARDIVGFVAGDPSKAEHVIMNPYNGDWDVFYPLPAVLDPYKVQLESYVSPWAADGKFTVTAANDVIDLDTGTRSLRIVVRHPGLIWTVIAFDAHVLSWTLDGNPPPEHARHYIKEASFYGEDTWSIDLVVSLRDEPGRGANHEGIKVNFVGINEAAMWPGKKGEKEKGGRAMEVFETLDKWIDEHTGGTVDAALIGCVGGVAVV